MPRPPMPSEPAQPMRLAILGAGAVAAGYDQMFYTLAGLAVAGLVINFFLQKPKSSPAA